MRAASVERLRRAVPALLPRISIAPEPNAIAAELQQFARAAELFEVELEASQVDQLPSFAWTARSTGSDTARLTAGGDAVGASFAVPAAGSSAQLRFAWLTDSGDVPPEADILLQLVADAVDARLQRDDSGRIQISKGRLRSV